ncbi:MAG TPA: hypothetical protein VJL90_01910, partial [Pseudorhodoplanes sp.]|nr:hypothetical protein [Pseudorhodoplanes sp.]
MGGAKGSQVPAIALAFWLVAPASGIAQTQDPVLVAPPRSIADITAILDQEKPDPAKRAKREADANAEPPSVQGEALGKFYFQRCQARAALGRAKEAIADCEKAISLGGDYGHHVSRVQQFLETQYRHVGDYKSAEKLLQEMIAHFSNQSKARLPGLFLRGIVGSLQVGDVPRAQNYVNRANAFLRESRTWSNPNFDKFRSSWEASVEDAQARLNENRGFYREAEAGFRRAKAQQIDAIGKISTWPSAPPRDQFEQSIDYLGAFEGRAKYKQGKLAEAEIDIRRALLSRLKANGKYNPDTAQIVMIFARLMNEQARWADSEKLLRTAIDIYQTLGYPDDINAIVTARYLLAAALYTQRRYDEANAVYASLDDAMKNWDEKRQIRFRYGWSRIFSAYFTRDIEKGIALAREYVTVEKKRVGDKHHDTVMARAILGAGLAFARKDAEAAEHFKASIPLLLATARESSDDETGLGSAADSRMQNVLEAYAAMLSRSADPGAASE